MSAPFAISVLDQSPVAQGSTGADALRNTIDLAVLADGLGYHRYWVAEHHGGPMLAGPSPEVLIGPISTSGLGPASIGPPWCSATQ
jgi:alkanesulfonate monooxygenase SsuD/methylene tetrahydromethanopterin reductase-like flavin-dependent oxidoreductase (luciferase family)